MLTSQTDSSATLTEIKDKYCHYYTDYRGRKQGEYKYWDSNGQLEEHCYYKDGKIHSEYKLWHSNGQLEEHCYYKDGKRHGEYKYWYSNGQLEEHCYYKDGENITAQVKSLVSNINNITKEERMLIKLKFNIKCLSS